MKSLKLIAFIWMAFVLQSCYKPGKIQIQNKISKVEITDVKWGDVYIATELLPGESSTKTIEEYEEKLPKKFKVSFKMVTNNKSIYLETEEEYLLNEDEEKLITLDDATKVKNPNP
jgi:hypothetical protein